MGYPGDQDGPPPWGRPSQQPWRAGEEDPSPHDSSGYGPYGGGGYGAGQDHPDRTSGAYRPHDTGADRWGTGPYGPDTQSFPGYADEPAGEWDRRPSAGGPDPGSSPSRPPSRHPAAASSRGGGRGGGRLVVGIVAALVLAAGGAGAYYMVSDRDPAATGPDAGPAESSAPPADPSPSAEPSAGTAAAPAGRWRHIDKRSTDPKPLTIAEVFAAKKLTVAGRSYTVTRKRLVKKCADGVYGAKLRQALKAGGCTQVMRASFVSADGKIMGTVGIANMRDTKGAERAGRVNGTHQFILPLAGTSGPTRDIGEGVGLVQALLRGHYLVLTWTEFTNGHKPSTSERTRLARSTDDVIDRTVSPAIGHRMLYGAPRA